VSDTRVFQYPRLATPADIPRLISGEGVHHVWPPPGTTVIRVAYPEPWVLVSGEPTAGEEGDWWVTDLANIVVGQDAWKAQLLVSLAELFTGPIVPFVGAIGRWPVIFEQGKSGGSYVRWIKSTMRGTLGGVEQFQFGINWGNPGSDPDIDETEALALAQVLGTQWGLAFSAAQTGVGTTALFSPDVVFTEVGVTQCTQTSGTNADGSGGNLEQDFETAWWAYPTATRPTGSQSYPPLPYEVACAVTFHTDKRGPSGRGRAYLPPFATPVMVTGGKFDTIPVHVAGDLFKRFFANVEGATTYEPVVVSRRRIVLNTINQITVGVIPDSQRRRRRSQDEAPYVAWTRP